MFYLHKFVCKVLIKYCIVGAILKKCFIKKKGSGASVGPRAKVPFWGLSLFFASGMVESPWDYIIGFFALFRRNEMDAPTDAICVCMCEPRKRTETGADERRCKIAHEK